MEWASNVVRARARPSVAGLLILAYAAVAAATVLDYGISWDEPLLATYGERVIAYFESGFTDRSHENLLNLPYYGPAFEVLPALVYRVVPEWKFAVRHAFIAFFAALGLIAVAKIGRRLSGDPLLPALAVLILVLMPAYYGHTFINSKDIPFATLFAWTMYAMLRAAERPDWRNVILCGGLAGLTLALRVGGLILFIIAGASLLLHRLLQRPRPAMNWHTARWLTTSAAVAWLIMVILWPWAHARPLANPLEALRGATSVPMAMEVLFDGRFYRSADVPARYLAEMFLATTPLATLALLATGFAVLIRRLVSRDIPLPHLALIVWIVIPPLLQIATGAPRYDSTRHFLFVYPAVALVAAVGAAAITRVVKRPLAVAGIFMALLSVVPAMIRLHPYQYAYFNEAAGGPAGAADKYESEYWATSYREAARWIAGHRCQGRPTSVLFALDRFSAPLALEYLPPDVRATMFVSNGIQGSLPDHFDYYAGVRRHRMELNFPESPVVHRVARMGATFAVIRGGCREGGGPQAGETEAISQSR